MAHNLEPLVDRFFGRAADLAGIAERLRSSALVTIVGPPGAGKTRIAREIAWQNVDQDGGAWFVRLAPARDAASAASAILAALGVRDAIDSNEAVVSALRGRALVVLDNVEHLDLQPLLAAILRDPDRTATLLCTSRRLLDVSGEVAWTLGPMTTNDDAVALLLDRVRRTFPAYDPAAQEMDAIRALADRLDRLPLALELVAPQLRMLSAKEILSQRRWDIAKGTLRQALEASLVDLEPDVRRAFEEATVFRGGFTLDAAENVLGAGKDAARVVRALLDRSLLFAGGHAMRRFRMLGVVRELAPIESDLEGAKKRHTEFYLKHCEAVARSMRAGAEGAREALAEELDNLVEVHARSGTSDANTALRVANVVEDIAPFPMRRALLDSAIDIPGADPLLLARAHLGRALLRRMQSDWSGSRADAEAATAIAERHGAKDIAGRAWIDLGAVAKHRGDFTAAIEQYRRGLELLRSAGDRAGEVDALGFLSIALLEDARPTEALEAGRAALELVLATDDRVRAAHAHSRLANILFVQGARADAAVHFEQALAITRAIGPRWVVAGTLMNYALVVQEDGDLERAAEMLREALRTFAEERSGSRHEVLTRVQLAWLRVEQRDPEAALAEIDAVRTILPADGRSRALFFAVLGCAEAMRDRHDAARSAFESAHAAATAAGVRDAVHVAEGIVESLRAVHERAHGNSETAARLEESAQKRLERAGANDDARLAARILARTLAPKEGRPIVFATGAAFVTSAGERVELEAHPLLARLVRELAAAREGVSADDLVERAWPDEKMTHASALNRLRVAMSRLRRMGLPMTAREGAYSLASDVQIVR